MRDRIIKEMKGVFGDDQPRIDHALKVLDYAETILRSEPGSAGLAEPNAPRPVSVCRGQTPARPAPTGGHASPSVVIAAAILHDIGIREAERKHGSSAAHLQETEGPPVARDILERLGLDADDIEHVCRIIASHHSARDIDTPEFRIIWDADWLVNLPDDYAKTHPDTWEDNVRGIFRTSAGLELALKQFGPGTGTIEDANNER